MNKTMNYDEAIRRAPLRSSFYLQRAKCRYQAHGYSEQVKADLQKGRDLFPMNDALRVPDLELLHKDSHQ